MSLEAERKAGDFVRGLIESGAVKTVHDVSDGGLLVALAEMALAGGRGFQYVPHPQLPAHAAAFGEDQGLYLIAASAEAAEAIVKQAEAAGLACPRRGARRRRCDLAAGRGAAPARQASQRPRGLASGFHGGRTLSWERWRP